MENNITRGKINAKKALSNSWKYGSFVYIFVIMFIIYWLVNPKLNGKAIANLFIHAFPVGIVALGMGMIIISGEIDLSVGAIWAFSGGIGVIANNAVAEATGNLSLAMFVGFLTIVGVGAVCGFINGFMVGKMKIPAFIATLGTLLILRSMCQFVLSKLPSNSSGQNIYAISPYYDAPWYQLNQLKVAGIPIIAIVFVAIVLIIFYVAKYTKFGRRMYAIGSNNKAASLAGINVAWNKIAIYTLSGALIGFSSFLNLGQNMSIEASSAGNLFELFAIASCVIGGISMAGGKGNILGILFGSLSYTMIDKIIQSSTNEPLIMDAIKGFILLVAVILQIGLLEKTNLQTLLMKVGIMHNPKQIDVLEATLRKKVNNVKIAYDKKLKKVMSDNKLDATQADEAINKLLDEREAIIVKLNETYDLKIDNAHLKAKEYARKVEINARKAEMRNKISELKLIHKKQLKVAKFEKKYLVKDLNELAITHANELKELILAELNAVHELEANVDVLNENAKHVLERDNNQEVYDKTMAKIQAYVEKVNANYEARVAKETAKYDGIVTKANETIQANKANEEAQIQQNAEFVTLAKEKQAVKEAAKAEKVAKKEQEAAAKAEKAEALRVEMEEKQAHIDSIIESRGMRK